MTQDEAESPRQGRTECDGASHGMPDSATLRDLLAIVRRVELVRCGVETRRFDIPSPDFPVSEGTGPAKAAAGAVWPDGGNRHKTVYRSSETFEYKNVLGWVLDSITLKPTIWTPDGCKITKAELYIESNLGIGAEWIKKNVKKTQFKKFSEQHNCEMECVILEYDLEWQVTLRIGWLRLLTINVLTLQGFYQICADGTVTSG